jgi:hypothetical protein
MNTNRPTVKTMAAPSVPDALPPAITRPRQHVQAVLTQSLLEMGADGRTALAWHWALTGTRPSPVTLSLPPGRAPTPEEILAEADADPEGSTAPPGVPTDFCDQIGEARCVLRWLAGNSDEIPVDCENRGRFIGARDDYARTDDEIREVRDRAQRGLDAFDLPDPIDPAHARDPWRWTPAWMNAAWLRGVRDFLDWVLGGHTDSPLRGRPLQHSQHGLAFEDETAEEIAGQGRPGGIPVDPGAYPPPQYGEAVQATIRWLRGETTAPSVSSEGCSPYVADH